MVNLSLYISMYLVSTSSDVGLRSPILTSHGLLCSHHAPRIIWKFTNEFVNSLCWLVGFTAPSLLSADCAQLSEPPAEICYTCGETGQNLNTAEAVCIKLGV